MPDIWMDVDAALSEVPVNVFPLTDDTDFKTREESVTYDQAGMDLVWNFVTTAGAYTQTAVTPTTGGDYDWANQGNGMYSIEIPASGGASINNDTEGFGWFSGYATGILPWRGPVIGFRAAGLNNVLIDSAYSATRGFAGTALPDAAADAAGGLPISDVGGLDLDAKLANTNEVTAARMGALTDWINGGRLDLLLDAIKAVTDAMPDGGALTALLASIASILEDTAEIGAAGAGLTEAGGTGDQLTAVPWNAAWDAEVQSECADAITAASLPTAAEVKTAMEAQDGDLDRLVTALVNKRVWTNADGALEMFSDANVSHGSIASQITTDGTYTTNLRAYRGDCV